MKKILFYLVLALFFSNCNGVKKVKTEDLSQTKNLRSGNQNVSYTIVKLYNKQLTESNPTIKINKVENMVSGFSGCNSYSCPFTGSLNNISFQQPIATKVYCMKSPEDLYFKMLTEVKSMKFSKDSLFFLDGTGKELAFAKEEITE